MRNDYEQMELDITLDGDRALKDNVQEVARFALAQIMQNKHPAAVKNRHEGYGIAAEMYSNLQRNNKAVDVEMKSMLALLPNGEGDFTNLCGSLYNTAIDTAVAAINLAAQSRRIMEDLYYSDGPTPIEEYIESMEEGPQDEEDADGFEAAEAAEPAEPADAESADEAETNNEKEED